jgi:hypothetical protein
MTAHIPDFDRTLAPGAVHRSAGGESAAIRVLTDATVILTSGHVTFEDSTDPLPGYMCPLRRGVLPETPPVPPGHYAVHLAVADIADGTGTEPISRVAAVRLVVRAEPAVAWDIHEDYPDGRLAAEGGQTVEGNIVVGLTDCQMCGTFYFRELIESAVDLGDRAVSHTANYTDDWFVEAVGSGYLEENGFPSEPVEDAMVMFPTGWTRGYYRTWAGRGADARQRTSAAPRPRSPEPSSTSLGAASVAALPPGQARPSWRAMTEPSA